MRTWEQCGWGQQRRRWAQGASGQGVSWGVCPLPKAALAWSAPPAQQRARQRRAASAAAGARARLQHSTTSPSSCGLRASSALAFSKAAMTASARSAWVAITAAGSCAAASLGRTEEGKGQGGSFFFGCLCCQFQTTPRCCVTNMNFSRGASQPPNPRAARPLSPAMQRMSRRLSRRRPPARVSSSPLSLEAAHVSQHSSVAACGAGRGGRRAVRQGGGGSGARAGTSSDTEARRAAARAPAARGGTCSCGAVSGERKRWCSAAPAEPPSPSSGRAMACSRSGYPAYLKGSSTSGQRLKSTHWARSRSRMRQGCGPCPPAVPACGGWGAGVRPHEGGGLETRHARSAWRL